MDTEKLARVLRQHARSALAMGVDFLPIGSGVPAGPPGDPPHGGGSSDLGGPPLRGGSDEPVGDRPTPEPKLSGFAAAASLFGGGGAEPAAQPEATVAERPDPDEAARLLAECRRRYETDAPHQHFVTDFQNIVFGEGSPSARLMFIGEAPGAEEDKTGRPFVGRAGQLLDKMIAAMGLSREEVYITNILKTRPPNNATPTIEEAERCAPYLYEQIAIIRPEAIVTLGLPATRLIVKSTEAMGRLRGRWASWTGHGVTVPVMPTYHPAYLLRNYTPAERQKVWDDLQKVIERLGLAKASADPAR